MQPNYLGQLEEDFPASNLALYGKKKEDEI
jgi:hypothetical protein